MRNMGGKFYTPVKLGIMGAPRTLQNAPEHPKLAYELEEPAKHYKTLQKHRSKILHPYIYSKK